MANSPEGDNPFAKFLQESTIYQQFIVDADGNEIPSETPEPKRKELPVEVENGVYRYDLHVSLAHFDLTVVTKPGDNHVSLTFPSRELNLDPAHLLIVMDGLIETAYPNRRIAPSVALLGGGKEQHFDLKNYWEGRQYERALRDKAEGSRSTLSSIVYYLNLSANLPIPAGFEPKRPSFMYGFNLGDNNHPPSEFVNMTHLKARTLDSSFVQELLPRNNQYVNKNLSQNANDLTEMIRDTCKLHGEQPLFW